MAGGNRLRISTSRLIKIIRYSAVVSMMKYVPRLNQASRKVIPSNRFMR
jgi:hypothetical protein